jgi:hypothetical protein
VVVFSAVVAGCDGGTQTKPWIVDCINFLLLAYCSSSTTKIMVCLLVERVRERGRTCMCATTKRGVQGGILLLLNVSACHGGCEYTQRQGDKVYF